MLHAVYLFQDAVQTLEKYVKENTTLSVHIDVSSYPVRISFLNENKQMSMFVEEESEKDYETAAELQFIFYDKIQIKTKEDFSIAEEVFNKLKNLSKEVNRLFLNAYFEKSNEARRNIMQDFSECKGISKIGKSAVGWEGKEFYLAVVKPQDILNSFIKYLEIEVR